MTKQEKLKGLMEWLDSKGINYSEDYDVSGTKADLFVHGAHIGISLNEDDSDEIFKIFRTARIRPFFIRESETMEFVIEKMDNCLNGTDSFGIRVAAQHTWHAIGWGHRHRHHLGFNFDKFLEEFRALAAQSGKDEAQRILKAKYRPVNIANTELMLKKQSEKSARNKMERDLRKKQEVKPRRKRIGKSAKYEKVRYFACGTKKSSHIDNYS